MRNKRLIILFSILLSIAIIVIFGSIIFSVSTITTFGYNINVYDEGQALSREILDAANIQGRSIFLLNDDRIIAEIEEAVPQIQVVNIERLFPNRVKINFVKMYNYFRVYRDGNYYSLRSSGRITNINEEADRNFIDIFADRNPFLNLSVGDYMFNRTTSDFLMQVVHSFEALGVGESAASNLIEFVNISYSQNNVYIGMRGGGIIRIIGRENFLHKLQLGLSVFISESLGRGHIVVATTERAFVSQPSEYAALRDRLTQI